MKLDHESLFSKVFNSSPLAICIATVEGGQMIAFNKSCVDLFGYPEEVLASSSTLGLGIWHDPKERAHVMALLLEQGCCEDYEARLVRADGQVRDTRITLQLIDLEAGRCVLTFARDVTEQRRAERSLRESQERFQQSFTFASIGKAIVGLDGRWIEVNPALCDMLGYSPQELLQCNCLDITHPEDLEADLNWMGQMLAGTINTYQMEKRYFHRQGHKVWGLLSVSMVHDAHGAPLYFLSEIQDISERKRQEFQITQQQLALEVANAQLETANAQLERLAMTDSLTGLQNRRSFDEHLQQEVERAIRQGSPLSLLLIDVDRFKAYNDDFGHPAGDITLRQVAHLIQAQARSIDITARYGGEEFAVILPHTDRSGCLALAERFRRAFEICSWPRRSMTASIGAVTWAPSITCLNSSLVGDDLVSQADQALYEAKGNGRNCVKHVDYGIQLKMMADD